MAVLPLTTQLVRVVGVEPNSRNRPPAAQGGVITDVAIGQRQAAFVLCQTATLKLRGVAADGAAGQRQRRVRFCENTAARPGMLELPLIAQLVSDRFAVKAVKPPPPPERCFR